MKKSTVSFISSLLLMSSTPGLAFESKIDLGIHEIPARDNYTLNLADFPFDKKITYSIFCIVNPGSFDTVIGLKPIYIYPMPEIYVNGDKVRERTKIKGNTYNRLYFTPIKVKPHSQIKLSNYDQNINLTVQCSADIDI